MGEGGKRVLRVKFDGKLMLEFHGTKISNDVGSAIFHKVDKPIGFKYTWTIRIFFAFFIFGISLCGKSFSQHFFFSE